VANPNTTSFGRYLKYARALSLGAPDEAKAILDSFGVAGVITKRKASRFSRDVAHRLTERGYQVSLEVGSSGFFVDIAVHHPSIPGNYVLGIECDGAFFHSLPYARDRDKAREALLARRVWRILRVWGPDWSRSRETELARIEAAIREALGTPPKKATVIKLRQP
jgi:very-short-patch-repair endonuclease